jgi:hypothetical protein
MLVPRTTFVVNKLAPVGWEHINLIGDYVWHSNKRVTQGIRSRNGKNRTLSPREWSQRSSRLFLPAELADEGVEGRREKEPEAGHANHTE